MLLVIYYHFDYMKEMLFLFPPLHMPNMDFDKLQSTDYTEQNGHGE